MLFRILFLSTPSARRATLFGCSVHAGFCYFYPRPPRGGRHLDLSSFSTISIISIHALREEGDAVGAHAAFHKGISIHALREEGDGRARIVPLWAGEFLSTPSARRATRAVEGSFAVSIYFYPRPPRGGRRGITGTSTALSEFLSTPSARRATIPPIRQQRQPERFLSTPSARRATAAAARATARPANFYPRPPRGGRRHRYRPGGYVTIFLSTPSARRATPDTATKVVLYEISIHALREEGDLNELPDGNKEEISIHALREEGDGRASSLPTLVVNFYPRPPRGGRLRFGLCAALPVHISIHALREEGDPQLERGKLPVTNYFYPRPPRGGRRSACRRKLRCCPISIHALREEGDCRHARDHAVQLNFYPRPPRGGRQYLYRSYHTLGGFLSTPSARRATPTATTSLNSRKNFYPRPPRGGRPVVVLQHVGFHQFLSTPSARRATLKTTITTNVGGISIHALREEGDRRAFLQGRLPVYFYPRPPRGGRHFTDPEDTCPG